MDKVDHEIYLAFGKQAAKRHHAVAAIGDVPIYFRIGAKLEFPVAQVRYLPAVVQGLTFALRAMTDRAVLPEEGSLVSFAF